MVMKKEYADLAGSIYVHRVCVAVMVITLTSMIGIRGGRTVVTFAANYFCDQIKRSHLFILDTFSSPLCTYKFSLSLSLLP